MQHPSLTSPYNYNDSLREQIQAMSSFQTNLTHFFQNRDQQLSLRSSKVTQATKLAHQETFKIKQILTEFVQDCRTEWVMIWQQFFSIFQKIADLYQIKIEKLQTTLHQKDMLIQTLQFERKSLRQLSKYNPPSLQQTHQYRQIEKSSNRTDQYENFNDKTNRRVKISDVIAEYTQSSSSVVSMNHQTSFGEAVTEERQSSEHIESQAPIVLMEIAQHLNRQSMSTHPIFLSQKHNKYSQRMVGDNCFEMSAIMSENSSEGVSPQKGLKFKKYSSKANKENSLVYSKRLKENDQRKRTNYYTKNAKSYESQVLSSACKLDQLRKNLLQRRRSEHLL